LSGVERCRRAAKDWSSFARNSSATRNEGGPGDGNGGVLRSGSSGLGRRRRSANRSTSSSRSGFEIGTGKDIDGYCGPARADMAPKCFASRHFARTGAPSRLPSRWRSCVPPTQESRRSWRSSATRPPVGRKSARFGDVWLNSRRKIEEPRDDQAEASVPNTRGRRRVSHLGRQTLASRRVEKARRGSTSG
jgi:hypothetical protein